MDSRWAAATVQSTETLVESDWPHPHRHAAQWPRWINHVDRAMSSHLLAMVALPKGKQR